MNYFLFITLLIMSKSSMAASCCGGGSNLPSLITGDNRAQIGLTLSNASEIGRTNSTGTPTFWNENKDKSTQVASIKGAYLFDNFLQFGVETSLLSKKYVDDKGMNESDSELGDTSLVSAYEFMPETSSSFTNPRGFSFFKLTIPTGTSNFENQNPGLTDVSGKGLWTASLGMAFTKVYRGFDYQVMAEGHHSLERTFIKSDENVSPGPGTSAILAVGYSPSRTMWRFGAALSPHYESKKTITTNSKVITTSEEYYWDSSISASYMVGDYGYTASYVDQTLIGPTKNTTLSRTISISLLRRWKL